MNYQFEIDLMERVLLISGLSVLVRVTKTICTK